MTELYKRTLTGFILGLLVISSLFFTPSWAFAVLVTAIMIYVLLYEWPLLFHPNQWAFWLVMLFYPLIPFILIIHMQLSGYEIMNLLLITLVASYDAGAYLVGKKFGYHKIWPAISPAKTWEGFAGGLVLAYLLSQIFFGHLDWNTQLTIIVPFVLLVSIFALLGDLFESYLKRRAGIKDSGSLLPGHGGILDRIDGILFASVIIYALRGYLKLLLNHT